MLLIAKAPDSMILSWSGFTAEMIFYCAILANLHVGQKVTIWGYLAVTAMFLIWVMLNCRQKSCISKKN